MQEVIRLLSQILSIVSVSNKGIHNNVALLKEIVSYLKDLEKRISSLEKTVSSLDKKK